MRQKLYLSAQYAPNFRKPFFVVVKKIQLFEKGSIGGLRGYSDFSWSSRDPVVWEEITLSTDWPVVSDRALVLPDEVLGRYLAAYSGVDNFLDIFREFSSLQKLNDRSLQLLEEIEAFQEVHNLFSENRENTLVQLEHSLEDEPWTFLKAQIERAIEQQNDQMLAQKAYQMVENQHHINKTTLLKACELEVSNELRNDLVNLSEHTPHFLNGKASISNFSHFPNPSRSATVNFRHGYGEFGGGDSNWGGSGGGNWNNGGVDFGDDGGHDNENVHLAYQFILWFFLLSLVIWLYSFILKKIKKLLEQFNRNLNTLNQKDPTLWRKISSLISKGLVLLLALLSNQESFVLALRTLGGRRLRNLLRILSFLFRGFVLASLFLGMTPPLLNCYSRFLNLISPWVNQTIHLLAGPPNADLSVLFLEKLLKCILASLIFGGICVFVREAKSSKNRIFCLLLGAGLFYGFYFVLTDFFYIRELAVKLAADRLFASLVTCQLGRMSLVVGSLLLIRSFSFLPTSQGVFLVLLYGLGVYSLAFLVE